MFSVILQKITSLLYQTKYKVFTGTKFKQHCTQCLICNDPWVRLDEKINVENEDFQVSFMHPFYSSKRWCVMGSINKLIIQQLIFQQLSQEDSITSVG